MISREFVGMKSLAGCGPRYLVAPRKVAVAVNLSTLKMGLVSMGGMAPHGSLCRFRQPPKDWTRLSDLDDYSDGRGIRHISPNVRIERSARLFAQVRSNDGLSLFPPFWLNIDIQKAFRNYDRTARPRLFRD